jgi:hypothetical protein
MNFSFNASQYKASQGGGSSAPSVGKHPCAVSKWETVENNQKNGFHLKLTFYVTQGESQGKTISTQYNLWHRDSPKAVEIASQQLAALCLALGLNGINQSFDELLNKPMGIEVGKQDNNDKYVEIKKVLNAQGNDPCNSAPAPVQQPVSQQQAVQQPAAAQQLPPSNAFGNTPAQQPQVQTDVPFNNTPQQVQNPGFNQQPANTGFNQSAPATDTPPWMQ